MEVRNLVKADDIPYLDHAFLAPGHVSEKVSDRGPARQEGGVGRDFLNDVALARTARPELDEVVIPLRQGNETDQE